MKSQRIPMTMEEFRVMPWQLGWKHEYFDGMAFLTPRQISVTTVVEVSTRTIPSLPCSIRSVVPEDFQSLVELYFQVFQDSVEFCNYQDAEIQKSAQRCIEKYFGTVETSNLSLSRVAISPDRSVIGAALVIIHEDRSPFLRLLCIDPAWQRQGIATGMMATILNALADQRYQRLKSCYFLANQMSRHWHHKFGFQDQPDVFVTRLYFRQAQHELWRHQQLEDLSLDELSKLDANVQQWKARMEIQESEWKKSLLNE